MFRSIATFARRFANSALAAAALATAVATTASAATIQPINLGNSDTAGLMLSGRIIQGDLARLQDEVGKLDPTKKVVLMLDSPGGDVDTGLALGRFVHAKRITTVVGEGPGCASACSFVFLAGRDGAGDATRILMSGARLGLHQVRINSTSTEPITQAMASARETVIQNGIAKIEAFFRELSIPGEFLSMMLSAPTNSMYYVRELDALRLGIYVMDASTGRLISPEGFRQRSAMR